MDQCHIYFVLYTLQDDFLQSTKMEPVDEEEELRGGATEARSRRSRSRRRRRSRSQRHRRKSRSRHGRRRRGRKSQAHIPRHVHIPYINLGRRWDGCQMDSRDANWQSCGVRSLIKPTDMLSSKKNRYNKITGTRQRFSASVVICRGVRRWYCCH